MILALLLVQASMPLPVQRTGDWTLGCDNARACRAVTRSSEGDTPLTVSRDGAPTAAAALEVPLAPAIAAGTRLTLAVDGKVLAQLIAPGGGSGMALPFEGKLAAALTGGRHMTLTDPRGRVEARVSLAGLGATLQAIDAAQLRGGTRTALRRAGRRAVDTIPPVPALPVIDQPEVTGTPPRKFTAKDATRLIGRDKAKCGRATPHVVRLDAASNLLAVGDPCVADAVRLFVLPEKGKPAPPAFENGTAPADPHWDGARRRLTDTDTCGTIRDYAWDGARFRLAEERVPVVCGRSDGYFTTWRTQVVVR